MKAEGNGRNPFYEKQFEGEPDEWFALRRELLNALEAWENNKDNERYAAYLREVRGMVEGLRLPIGVTHKPPCECICCETESRIARLLAKLDEKIQS